VSKQQDKGLQPITFAQWKETHKEQFKEEVNQLYENNNKYLTQGIRAHQLHHAKKVIDSILNEIRIS
jgi:hypothetical protein